MSPNYHGHADLSPSHDEFRHLMNANNSQILLDFVTKGLNIEVDEIRESTYSAMKHEIMRTVENSAQTLNLSSSQMNQNTPSKKKGHQKQFNFTGIEKPAQANNNDIQYLLNDTHWEAKAPVESMFPGRGMRIKHHPNHFHHAGRFLQLPKNRK